MTSHVLDVNPAHAVRGPKYVVKKGKTPVLTAEEARVLLDSITIVRNTGARKPGDTTEPAPPHLVGLRDRALIGVMVFTFARINAVLEMKVRDYFVQGRRGWVRLHEKGGKEHELPCYHSLERYLDEYIAAAGIADAASLLEEAIHLPSGATPKTEKPTHEKRKALVEVCAMVRGLTDDVDFSRNPSTGRPVELS